MTERPAQYIYSPAESTTRFVEYVNHLYSTEGIRFGVPSIDKRILPMRPGEVIGITGRPGHGKSSLQSYFAIQTARDIIKRQAEDEIVLFVTWEQPIEVQEAFFQSGLQERPGDFTYSISDLAWQKVDQQKVIEKAARSRVYSPIWVAGRSLKDANKRIPPMFVDTLFDEISRIKEDHGVRPVLVCFDYLQRIPTRGRGEQRNLQVAEAILNTSELAKSVGCPVILGVQAKSEIDHRDDKLPKMGDTYYSAELAHVVDKHFGIMKPIKYYEPGKMMDFNFGEERHHIPVDDFSLLIQMDKQRMERGMWRFAVRFDMSKMQISDFYFININSDLTDPERYQENGRQRIAT